MRLNKAAIVLSLFSLSAGNTAGQTTNELPKIPKSWTTAQICSEISRVSKEYKIPRAAFTRLIWTESRFDHNALSPKGAQGIAQFMPATAKERGLGDPYDPGQALEASASLLADLQATFGNFGLAAMAYNAGPGRVTRWLARRSNLPFETQDYIAAVTGFGASKFREREFQLNDFSLKKGQSFEKSCNELPVVKTRFRGISSSPRKPWGVQVAGNFSRTIARRSWVRVRGKLGVAIGSAKPNLYRERSRRGMRARWTVRIGANNRQSAINICRKIRSVGGFCLVKKN